MTINLSTLLLSQLWWIMPIFIAVVYFTIGFFICKQLIKNNVIESVLEYWLYFIFWLPMFLFGALITLLRWVGRVPKRIAENQIHKN
jgi:uncharacterized membrane protein